MSEPAVAAPVVAEAPASPWARPEWAASLAAAVAGVGLCALVLLVCVDITLRTLLNAPLAWSVEVSGYLMALVALFGLAWAERQDAHIRVEIVIERLSERRRGELDALNRWQALALVAVAAWQGAEFCFRAWADGHRMLGVLETPLWIPEAMIAPAFVLLILELARKSFARKDADSPEPGMALPLAVVGPLVVAACLIWRGTSLNMLGVSIPAPMAAIYAGVTALAFVRHPTSAAAFVVATVLLVVVGIMASDMAPFWRGVVLGAVLCVQLTIGLQVGYALGVCALWGLLFLLPGGQLVALPERVWGASASFELTAVPAFVLMGILLMRSGITAHLFALLASRMGAIPGSLAHASVVGCAIFSTISGSSMATAATVGSAACPEMVKHGYDRRLAYGAVAAGGTLGILIPPSIAMIIYGAVVGTSITALFAAGLIPGLLLVLLFMAVILAWSLMIPRRPSGSDMAQNLRSGDVGRMFLFFGLIIAVLGSIYAGLATPTEAGAIGALGGLLICGVMGRLSVHVVRESVLESLQVTALLMLVVCFAAVVTYVIDFTRMPRVIVDLLTPVIERPVLLFIGICLVYLVLGTFMEPISMMLVTLPIVFPLVTAAHFDPVWFGIVLVLLMEIGLLTPPIGMNLFVIKAIVPDAKLNDIVVGVLPFIAAMLLLLASLYVWPNIALWLPTKLQ